MEFFFSSRKREEGKNDTQRSGAMFTRGDPEIAEMQLVVDLPVTANGMGLVGRTSVHH